MSKLSICPKNLKIWNSKLFLNLKQTLNSRSFNDISFQKLLIFLAAELSSG